MARQLRGTPVAAVAAGVAIASGTCNQPVVNVGTVTRKLGTDVSYITVDPDTHLRLYDNSGSGVKRFDATVAAAAAGGTTTEFNFDTNKLHFDGDVYSVMLAAAGGAGGGALIYVE